MTLFYPTQSGVLVTFVVDVPNVSDKDEAQEKALLALLEQSVHPDDSESDAVIRIRRTPYHETTNAHRYHNTDPTPARD